MAKSGKLKKDLGLLEVFCISAGAMISSGIFILPALAYSRAGPSVLISYLIAGLIMLPTVMTTAELISAMPKSGGIYFMIDRSMGPLVGTLGGLASWLSLTFKSAFALMGMGIFLTLFFDVSDIHIKLVAVGFCILFTIINTLGVKASAKFQVGMVIILLSLMVLYIIVGLFSVSWSNFQPFPPKEVSPIIAAAGMVFISYMGATKVAAVAAEVKKPGKTLPMGMFLAWGAVTLLYLLVLFVTIGLLDHDAMISTDLPLSAGGDAAFPLFKIGLGVMSLAGLLAFVSTGNSGILTASRDPMAMSHDGLVPKVLGNTSKFGTPWITILLTSSIMIGIILFLDLDTFVKTASTLTLILFMMSNIAIIFMREANYSHYRPKFKAPFYPWIQMLAILSYAVLVIRMGIIPIAITTLFVLIGFGWFWFYARERIKREFAMLSVVKRIAHVESDHILDEELRTILLERDGLSEGRFKRALEDAVALDLPHFMTPDNFAKEVAPALSKKFKMSEFELNRALIQRGKNSNIIVRPTFAIITFDIEGKDQFQMAVVRTQRGARFSDDFPPVHAAFIVVHSPDQTSFYLHCLMWLIQIAEWVDFENEWKGALTKKGLKLVLLKAWEKRVKHMSMAEPDKGDELLRKM